MVELALVLPIFVAIIFGILEFGRAFMVHEMMTHASRIGARTAVLPFNNSNNDVKTKVESALADGSVPVSDVTVSILVNGTEGSIANAKRGDLVMVKATVPYSKVSLITPQFLSNYSVVGVTAMRRE